MEIRFSQPWQFPEDDIRATAKDVGVYARVKWAREREARFALVADRDSYAPATTEQHDRVIRALLTLDPDATVRTARAVYEGLQDFEKQRGKI